MDRKLQNGLIAVSKILSVDLTPITKGWLDVYQTRLANRGKADAVKFMKQLNTVAERYALHQPIEPIPWTKSDKNGYPHCINFAKQNLRSKDAHLVVLTLSVFRSVEDLRLPISKDISTITQDCSYDMDLMNSILSFIPSWVKRFAPLHLGKMKYHFTLKNGPNGHALKESDKDILAVMSDPPIYEAIRKCEDLLNDSQPMNVSLGANPGYIHSKLSQFPDKAGKTRTIAVIDYYSQRCLQPLHKGLMAFLANLVSDGTYSHQNVGRFAKQKTKEKSFIYCSDLTAFTDRFPAIIQKVLLSELLQNDDLTNSLWTLLAKRTFKVSWSNDRVTYQCGQPMGAYASWPLCTLAHHLIVEYCAKEVGKTSIQHNYRIIGDDNIITERKTADKYRDVMSMLGININQGKTVCSPKAAEYSAAEVAKQLYLNGTCLTPLTPGFFRDLRKPYMFNACIGVLRDRYEFFGSKTLAMLISVLFRKEKIRKLVWLLGTNPINGNIKPSDEGYDINCPWDTEKSAQYLENYRKIIIESLIDQAQSHVDRTVKEFDDFLDDDLDLLDFDTFDINKIKDFAKHKVTEGSPWIDSSRPEPRCYSAISISMESQLTDIINGLSGVSRDEPLEDIVARFDYVPDPRLPYQDRYELRHKRMSSSIVKLFNYNNSIEFTTIPW